MPSPLSGAIHLCNRSTTVVIEDPTKSKDRSRSLMYLRTTASENEQFHRPNCQYEVRLRFSKRRGAWLVTESQSHNHEPSLSAAAHPVHRTATAQQLSTSNLQPEKWPKRPKQDPR